MYNNHSLSESKLCVGLYCGKLAGNESCGSCPNGYISDKFSICTKCIEKLLMYDWLFLGFIVIQPIVFNFYFSIKLSVKLKSNKRLWILQLSMIIESVIAFVLSLMIFEPYGLFQVTKCPTNRLSDWYTMFYNPSPNFKKTIYCTQEAVYPLMSVVIVYYCISICLTIFSRPWIIIYVLRDKLWIKSIYYTLYTYPILIIFYLTFCGLLYYSYGYIVFTAAILASAGLFSTTLIKDISDNDNLTITSIFKVTVLKPQNLLIVGCTWLALFYGIVSITELKYPTYYGLLFAVIPFPYLFFCLTLHFTNPSVELYAVI